MARFAILLTLFWSASGLTQVCGEPGLRHWTSVVKLAAAPVTLHWTGVREGKDAVCGIAYQTHQGKARVLSVFGQPQINRSESLIAFAACADDGCDKTILIADFVSGVVLKGVLPVSASQTYFSARWARPGRTLSVDLEGMPGQPSRQFSCTASREVVCVAAGI
jgi:hypothetical protein